MKYLKRAITAFLTILALQIQAQHPYYYVLNDENGLPSNEVYQVIQDNFGYMWIGCDAGLFRYDGFEYKQYRNTLQNGRSISLLRLDAKGRIWCGNFNGEIYRVEADSLRIIANTSKTNYINTQYTLDNDCNVWMLYNNMLVQHTDKGDTLLKYPIKQETQNIQVSSLEYKDKVIYISLVNSKNYIFDTRTKQIRILKGNADNASKVVYYKWGKELYAIVEETKGVGINLCKVTEHTYETTHTFISTETNSRLYNLCEDQQNKLWVCTANGVFLYNKTFKQLDETLPYFRGKKISNMYQDKEGSYWFTSLQDGIFVVPNMNVVRYDEQNSALSETNITALAISPDSTLITGSYTGKINVLDTEKNTISTIPFDKKTITTKKIICYNNTIYIAHGPLSILVRNKEEKNNLPYNIRDITFGADSMYYILPSINGKIAYKEQLNPNIDLVKNRVDKGGRAVVYATNENRVYYILNNGLHAYKNGTWTPITHNNRPIYASSMAYTNNTLYVATISNGLLLIQNEKITKQYNTANTILPNELKSICVSPDYIWVCGSEYLYRIQPYTNEIAYIGVTSGINPKDINAMTVLRKNMYLATNKGLVKFPENIDWKNTTKPTLNIVTIEHDNQILPLGSEVKLPFQNSDFSVKLSSVALRSRGKYTYKYRLTELDSNWTTNPAANSKVVFSSIPTGDYTFEVKALNEYGIESETRKIKLIIDSPLWQKWWFYLFVTALSVSILSIIFWFRIRYVKRKAELENKLTLSQLTALKAQMNPHFMYNALNSIQDLVVSNDIKNSNMYLSKFSKLMRNVLDASGKEKITLHTELEILHLYLELEKLRYGEDFQYQITLSDNIDTEYIKIPSMILQPFVENAIKHGLLHKKGNKQLHIDFNLTHVLYCTITDNGIGRKKSEEIKKRITDKHKSFATSATGKRIELLNKHTSENYSIETIDMEENGQATGTKVILSIPV